MIGAISNTQTKTLQLSEMFINALFYT